MIISHFKGSWWIKWEIVTCKDFITANWNLKSERINKYFRIETKVVILLFLLTINSSIRSRDHIFRLHWSSKETLRKETKINLPLRLWKAKSHGTLALKFWHLNVFIRASLSKNQTKASKGSFANES